jgi:hypothetical protein
MPKARDSSQEEDDFEDDDDEWTDESDDGQVTQTSATSEAVLPTPVIERSSTETDPEHCSYPEDNSEDYEDVSTTSDEADRHAPPSDESSRSRKSGSTESENSRRSSSQKVRFSTKKDRERELLRTQREKERAGLKKDHIVGNLHPQGQHHHPHAQGRPNLNQLPTKPPARTHPHPPQLTSLQAAQATSAAALEAAVLEVQRQREMFRKLPVRSYSGELNGIFSFPLWTLKF